jgi:hypothetical protein
MADEKNPEQKPRTNGYDLRAEEIVVKPVKDEDGDEV